MSYLPSSSKLPRMATRQSILSTVTDICQSLYDQRQDKIRSESRVSAEEQASIKELVSTLDRLRHLDPFPTIEAGQETTLRDLQESLRQEDSDREQARESLLSWAATFASPSDLAPAAAPELPEPGNLRMLDNLHQFQKGITRARLRLMRAGEPFDRDRYKEARNAYTLAYAAYQPRLELGQIAASLEENVAFENELLNPLDSIDGGKFPGLVKSAADFIRQALFGPATFIA